MYEILNLPNVAAYQLIVHVDECEIDSRIRDNIMIMEKSASLSVHLGYLNTVADYCH